LLSFDAKTLALERVKVKLLLNAGEPQPKGQFSASQPVGSPFDRNKQPAPRAAEYLWHQLATDVLKFVCCPNLDDEED
jgi:hypothetical protein